ncbi:MAG: leucyl/phenylalanyl-tRNA--protein transferase [Vicinamibacteria bacterium]|nr:leucyl/phenylalanyl-tRNA--protein transferase [Vicinamibacteria bacterium]
MPWLSDDDPLPPVDSALRRPNGLLAAGGGLSVRRLVDAYSKGCFPWYSEGEPVLWWSPDPRMVLVPAQLHVPRSLARRMRRGDITITADLAFADVMAGCAEPRDDQGGTWITDEMMSAYLALHAAGHAHSIEAWQDGLLVGGLYGVALGRAFFGESMFTRVPDASKIALMTLVAQLQQWEFGVVDCQMKTEHLARFGAREIPRAAFVRQLDVLVPQAGPPCPWRMDPIVR